jgi:hypothetical protein
MMSLFGTPSRFFDAKQLVDQCTVLPFMYSVVEAL